MSIPFCLHSPQISTRLRIPNISVSRGTASYCQNRINKQVNQMSSEGPYSRYGAGGGGPGYGGGGGGYGEMTAGEV